MPVGVGRGLRLCGAFLLFLSGAGCGVSHHRRLCRRTKTLEETVFLLRRLHREAIFRHADLRKQCESPEIRAAFPSLFLSETLSPPDCFRAEERRCFEEWMGELGHRTAEEESERLEWFIQRFEGFHAEAARKQAQGEQLDIRLGVGIGAIVAFLVL